MSEYSIIPQPVSIQYQPGNFHCPGLPVIANSEFFQNEAGIFTTQLAKTWGKAAFSRNPGRIRLIKKESATAASAEMFPDKESYSLEIQPDTICISAATGTGIYRGLQTLRQLILSGYQENGALSIPCGIIEDVPRFSWRGFMLDCSRHFYSVAFIKHLLDALSLQHINVFHWHLTDDQGWRLPVDQYPLLTSIGSRRRDTRDHNYYKGGFYTKKEIKDIVTFAAERHIEVVPEVDLPGHTSAVLAAYPGLGCTGGPYRVEERYGIFEDVLCAGNDDIFPLIEAVFDTLAELFPSRYVHIGGDEVRFNNWQECPKCEKRLEELELDSPEQLQSWITFRLAAMLHKRGKTAIGWDEVLDDTEQFPLPDNVVIMSWRGEEGGNKATALGRRVIMTPQTNGCYLDHKNYDDPEEPGQLGFATVAASYSLNPITAEMENSPNKDAASLVLGGQGNLWSEIIYAGKIAEYMIFPRICALAESFWSKPGDKNMKDFSKRLTVHQRRLDKLGVIQYRGPLE